MYKSLNHRFSGSYKGNNFLELILKALINTALSKFFATFRIYKLNKWKPR